jgi:hypothetical protein
MDVQEVVRGVALLSGSFCPVAGQVLERITEGEQSGGDPLIPSLCFEIADLKLVAGHLSHLKSVG